MRFLKMAFRLAPWKLWLKHGRLEPHSSGVDFVYLLPQEVGFSQVCRVQTPKKKQPSSTQGRSPLDSAAGRPTSHKRLASSGPEATHLTLNSKVGLFFVKNLKRQYINTISLKKNGCFFGGGGRFSDQKKPYFLVIKSNWFGAGPG